MKRVVVVGSTLEIATEKLKEIKDSLDKNEIKLYQKTRLITSDGTEYKAIWLNEQTKGQRYDCVYVEHGIDFELFSTIIQPMGKFVSEIHWY